MRRSREGGREGGSEGGKMCVYGFSDFFSFFSVMMKEGGNERVSMMISLHFSHMYSCCGRKKNKSSGEGG